MADFILERFRELDKRRRTARNAFYAVKTQLDGARKELKGLTLLRRIKQLRAALKNSAAIYEAARAALEVAAEDLARGQRGLPLSEPSEPEAPTVHDAAPPLRIQEGT